MGTRGLKFRQDCAIRAVGTSSRPIFGEPRPLPPSSAPLLPNAPMQPDVAIVIVSFHSLEDIVRCLAALEKSSWRHFRVVICENGGEDRLPQTAGPAADPNEGRPAGGAFEGTRTIWVMRGGINFSIDHTAPADIYWILNPDTEPAPQALEAMLARLNRGDCTAVGHDLVLDGRTPGLVRRPVASMDRARHFHQQGKAPGTAGRHAGAGKQHQLHYRRVDADHAGLL